MTRIVAFASMTALSALATRAADDAAASGAAAAPVAAAPNPIAEFEFPNLPGKRSFDCTTVPAETRLDFLKMALRSYIANRLNGVHTRHQKDPNVIAWNAYEEATKADALQSAVAKPTVDKPAEPNYEEAYTRAVADLTSGTVRRQSDEPKARKVKDPLTAVVTDVVTRAVFDSNRAADPKYTYIKAKAEVGVDGVAYLNKMIEAKVAAGADRAALEKARDTKYINPAKAMLGLSTGKALNELPSIL